MPLPSFIAVHDPIASFWSQGFAVALVAILYRGYNLRPKTLGMEMERGFALTIKEQVRCRWHEKFLLSLVNRIRESEIDRAQRKVRQIG